MQNTDFLSFYFSKQMQNLHIAQNNLKYVLNDSLA